MSRRDKLVTRLKGRPKDFTWDELVRLLAGLDYIETNKGKDWRFPQALHPYHRADYNTAQTASREYR